MATVQEEIKELCKQQDAVILAHYYVDGSVQDIADYVGDSFYLAKVAKEVSNKTIVFCGVTFMGESALILNPKKTVLMPDMESVCPMALMVTEKNICDARKKYDDLAVVCYINSMANIKALCDVCVTSSNAVKIVQKLSNKNFFFIPDNNLGRYVASKVPEKNIILNNGFCHVHTSITAQDVKHLLSLHPNAKVIAHPECSKEVCDIANYLGSTKELIEYVKNDNATEFIVCTEKGVLHQMKNVSPYKNFYFVEQKQVCQNMKLITLEKIKTCLQKKLPTVSLNEDVMQKAYKPLEKMLVLASK